MKKYLLPISIILIVITLLPGCRSVGVKSTIAKERDELDRKEQWRYGLPTTETAPVRPAFPKIEKAVLKNGLSILVVEDHNLPIAQVALVVKAGAANDPHHLSGLSYMTALMLKEGTKHKSSLKLAEDFANLGTQVTASVSKDMTQLSSSVLSDKVKDVVQLFASMIIEPRMAPTDFARVKKLYENQLASQLGVASYVAQTNFLMAAYGKNHPYAYPNGGLRDTVAKIELKDVKAAHARHFGANAAALVVVGDVTLKQIEKLANKNFGDFKKISHVVRKAPEPPIANEMQTRLVQKAHSPQTYILLGQPAVSQRDSDLAVVEILQSIIAGLPTSRLDKNLREAKGWTYGVLCQLTPLLGKGPIMVSTSIQVPYGADAIAEILKEYERLRSDLVSDKEFEVAKNSLLRSFDERYNTVGKIASMVANEFTYSLPSNYDETLYDNIGKVTKEDIKKVANRILKKESTTVVAVGDLEALKEPIAHMNVGKVTIIEDSSSGKVIK